MSSRFLVPVYQLQIASKYQVVPSRPTQLSYIYYIYIIIYAHIAFIYNIYILLQAHEEKTFRQSQTTYLVSYMLVHLILTNSIHMISNMPTEPSNSFIQLHRHTHSICTDINMLTQLHIDVYCTALLPSSSPIHSHFHAQIFSKLRQYQAGQTAPYVHIRSNNRKVTLI